MTFEESYFSKLIEFTEDDIEWLMFYNCGLFNDLIEDEYMQDIRNRWL